MNPGREADTALSPLNVTQTQRTNLSPADPVGVEQKDHGVVAPPEPRVPIHVVQQHARVLFENRTWDIGQTMAYEVLTSHQVAEWNKLKGEPFDSRKARELRRNSRDRKCKSRRNS